MTSQFTLGQALLLADHSIHTKMTTEEIAITQMVQDYWFMPFEVFHVAVSESMNAPIFSATLALNRTGFINVLLAKGLQPVSFEELMGRVEEKHHSQ